MKDNDISEHLENVDRALDRASRDLRHSQYYFFVGAVLFIGHGTMRMFFDC